MTKIKTAQAWLVWTPRGNVYKTHAPTSGSGPTKSVVIVHGLNEAEVHEAVALRSACRELGVETVEQLRAKVQPDPRVAVLDRLGLLTLDQIEAVLVCAKAAVRASKTEGGIIITEDVTAVIDSIIAAKRGEG